MELKQALQELRKTDKRNFNQSIDLIINLKGIDIKRDNISAIIPIPHKVKDKKICGFLTKKSNIVKTITLPDFSKYKEKKPLKNLVKEYDFFIATAQLMPSVATTFGKILGPLGKMPSPQLGIVMKEDDATIEQLIDKIAKSVKIKVKEPSVKIIVGKENMKDEQIIENILAIHNGFVNVLPTKKENIKSIMIKLTMGKPVNVEIK
ncbi:MAG: hypothetical protein AABW65_01695 [Nanoarchaeota archaeon]